MIFSGILQNLNSVYNTQESVPEEEKETLQLFTKASSGEEKKKKRKKTKLLTETEVAVETIVDTSVAEEPKSVTPKHFM
ncbi:MAG: hypothetical protein JST59_02300 [Actinobacteria bacterium]|nr:hypothetical protein [Actinomycetota bacterium]